MEQVTSKYADWTRGHVESLINILGEKNAEELRRGNLSVEFKEVIKKLFDKHGRRVPQGLKVNVCDADRNFWLNQPKLETKVDYANRITRLHCSLSRDTGITTEQLKTETERLLALIRGNPQIANIANGVWLPIILPKLITDDIGAELEQYLEGVGRSYVKTFGDRKFFNFRKGTLANEVGNVDDGSQHNQLIKRMKQGPVMGIHFPNPLQGFSINASREQMSTLPKGVISSGIDTVIAMATYPDILARDWNTPNLDLAAFFWQSATSYSLSFETFGDTLHFNCTSNLTDGCREKSSGLLFSQWA